MEGDGLLHPRGPLPPAVYWRRRVVVIGIAFLAFMLLLNRCAPGRGDDTDKAASAEPTSSTSGSASAKPSGKSSAKSTAKASTSTPSEKATASTSPKASAKPTAKASSSPPAGATPQCAVPTLQISVRADAASYPAGTQPVFTMTIKNSGTGPCSIDLSAASTELRITSGSDRIWSSDDCGKGAVGKATVLKGNETKTVAVTWNRKRSKTGTACVGADAQPGRYRVVGRIGAVSTGPDSFLLS